MTNATGKLRNAMAEPNPIPYRNPNTNSNPFCTYIPHFTHCIPHSTGALTEIHRVATPTTSLKSEYQKTAKSHTVDDFAKRSSSLSLASTSGNSGGGWLSSAIFTLIFLQRSETTFT